MDLIGMAQVLAALAYGVQGLRRGVTTWDWPSFNTNPARENNSQMERWSSMRHRHGLALAIANNTMTSEAAVRDLRHLHQVAAAGHNWINFFTCNLAQCQLGN